MSDRLPIVFAVGGSLLSTTVLAQTYIVTDLPTLGGSWTEARAINNAGQIAGHSELPNGDQRAVLWNDGILMDLGTLGGDESRAYALNEAGHVVGEAQTVPNGGTHAFLWQDGVMLDLGTFDGSGISRAYGINDAGHVVGLTHITGGFAAFVWSDGVMLPLDPAGCGSHDGWHINDSGLIAGSVRIEPICDERAAIWNVTGELVDVLDGVSHVAVAYARNAAGTIVGTDSGPVVWQDGALVEIASPFPALIQGDARDINVHGQVVGFFSLGSSHKAFLWDDGEVLDLTTSLAGGTQLLKQAWGINDNGQIVVDNKLLTPCIAADSQCDGEVGIVDLLALLAVWGPCPGCPLDLDGDETVGIVDFLLMLAAWGPYVPG